MVPSFLRCVVSFIPFSLAWALATTAFCQTVPTPSQIPSPSGQANRSIPAAAAPAPAQDQLPKRIFGIIPNYRSNASLQDAKPLTPKEKFKLAAKDSFDPGTFVLVGGLAGIAQWANNTPSYGQGAAGYGRYYGSTYGDVMIGNFMTEGVYPSLLHQDPRYFRRGRGSTWSRLKYACGQIFITHGDDKSTQVNYSELLGNATAVAISNAYNPDNRTVRDNVRRFGVQLGIDMAGNILKEFVPDLYRKVHPNHNGTHSYTGNQPVK
jgi:hypothetical protein